jgi:polar amino acid transport system substrate-binding protein
MRTSLALPFVGLLAWSLGTAAVPAATLEEIKSSGVLHVAVYHDYAPFADAGQGIDVDVGKALAAKLGLEAEVKAYPDADSVDSDLRNIVWRGHPLWRERLADVMMHVPVDPHVIKKNEQVRIFAPYFRERLVVARNRTRIPNLPTLQVFATEKIGVEVETLEDRYLVSSFGGLLRENVMHFKNLLDAAAALKKGDVSAVMGRRTLIEAGLGADSSKYEISTAPAPGLATSGWELGLAVKADNPELAAALGTAMADLLREGSVERVFTKRGLTWTAPLFEPDGHLPAAMPVPQTPR